MANNKATSLRTQTLEKIFQSTEFPWDGNASIYLSLHTASPGTSGNQTTSEANYTGYARVAVDRLNTSWNVTSNTVTNINDIEFPECTAGSQTVTHVGIGTDASGAGTLLYQGPLTSSEVVNTGNIPRIRAGTLVLTET